MLIIDMPMPKNCRECYFSGDCSFCEGYDDHCGLNRNNEPEIGFDKNGNEHGYWDFSCEIAPKEKPNWCPLRELVRCEDCKKRRTPNCPLVYGRETSTTGNDDWYCANGERKEIAE